MGLKPDSPSRDSTTLAVYAIQSVGCHTAVLWVHEDGVHPMRLYRISIWCLSGGDARASMPWYAPSGEKATDSMREEDSSIVDKPGECWTLVPESQTRKPERF